MKNKLIFSLSLLVLICMASAAFAQGVLNASETSYRDELNRIKLLPGSDVVADTIAQTEIWIDQAAEASARGDRFEANRLLKRVRFALEMLVVRVDIEKIKGAIVSYRKLASEAPKQISELRAEVLRLEGERDALKAELAHLQ